MISPNSRYLLTDIVQVINPVTGALSRPEFMDLLPRVTTVAADDSFVTPSTSTDWSHLALSTLGDARHWWIIADLSGVIDPFVELDAIVAVGGMVRAPSQNRFFFTILAPEQAST